MNETNEHDEKSNKAICLVVGVVLTSLIVGISGYNIHSTAYESQNRAAEAQLIQAQAELELRQSDAIQELVNDGMNPIAARCAVTGWNRPEDTTLCAFFVRDATNSKD